MSSRRGGLWGWVQDVGKTCGFASQPSPPPMWVRANPDLFPQEVPGMSDELLALTNQSGGSIEETIECVIDAFRCSARHLESLQQVLRRRALDRREKSGQESFPAEVEDVISEGSYQESFLEAFDGQSFELYSEEIVPCHAYRLALEVHSGGAYWSSIPVQETDAARQKVETVNASASGEGTSSIIAQFGAGQRGAVFVWRWQHLLDEGPYNVPEWLSRIIGTDGNDPLRKLLGELEGIKRWEQQVRQETSKYVKQGIDVKDPYTKEVLRLWPTEPDPHGGEQLKKCAWVEGLDSSLFVGRQVSICQVPYDGIHSLQLRALISKRHAEEGATPETNPPYRLTTTWTWTPPVASATVSRVPSSPGIEFDAPLRSKDSLLSKPGTTGSVSLHAAFSSPRPANEGKTSGAVGPNTPPAVAYAANNADYSMASPPQMPSLDSSPEARTLTPQALSSPTAPPPPPMLLAYDNSVDYEGKGSVPLSPLHSSPESIGKSPNTLILPAPPPVLPK